MTAPFYLPRILTDEEAIFTEEQLLASFNHVVVLAEPGGGKSELLESLARRLDVSTVTAAVFAHVGPIEQNKPLIIDAFDELARIDAGGIYKVLGHAKSANPTHVILSTRSSEWDNSGSIAFKNFFGVAPKLLRFREFDVDEQRAIFQHHALGEDFNAFQKELRRFDLAILMPNPQFLKLFTDAYIESGRQFRDKRSIFSQAVERLAKEANSHLPVRRDALALHQKIQVSSEIFAKLLLSGADGVGSREVTENRLFPLIDSLTGGGSATDLLATKLFKPGDTPDHHRPVHKIVSEYCAASYLVGRIADSSDHLTLSKCIPIIAPNSAVRDELRGLLGWMAALGGKEIQETAINLDAYGVLANGDPSQLDTSSKQLLINRLKDVEEQDPYFRRADFWRRFSVAGFFTKAVLDEIKLLLAFDKRGNLRQLMLELLTGSAAIPHLVAELEEILLSPEEEETARIQACDCLLTIDLYDPYPALGILMFEATATSLKVAARMIQTMEPRVVGETHLAAYFRICAHLYPSSAEGFERTIGGRYFIKRLIGSLDLTVIEGLMDRLSQAISCRCQEKRYACECNIGISKIVGAMADRYFELSKDPHDPARIYGWLRHLTFRGSVGSDRSAAVRVLQSDHALRQSIIINAFKDLTDKEVIFETKFNNFHGQSHSGLIFRDDDIKILVEFAFNGENILLWSSFFESHKPYRTGEALWSNPLRQLMRMQARQKPAFMKVWCKYNRETERLSRETMVPSFKHLRKMRRRRRREAAIHLENKKHIHENRELIESGRHWGWLVRFAWLSLTKPDKIMEEIGDVLIVKSALRNSLDFIGEHVPDLQKLAELQNASQSHQTEVILFAACREIMQASGNLEQVDRRLLRSLRTAINMHYDAVSEEELTALKTEVDRLIFPDNKSAEAFLRDYCEPQLAVGECHQVWWMDNDEAFKPLCGKISVEWLRRYSRLAHSTLDTLFELALRFADRDDVKEIIALRCAEFMFFWPEPTDFDEFEKRREFWFIRAWYLLDQAPNFVWKWLKENKHTVLKLHDMIGSFARRDRAYWPKITSAQVEDILVAFVDCWPKVHLPDSYGTGSPDSENAYRFMTDVIWSISADDVDNALPVLDRLINESRYADFHDGLKSIRSAHLRSKSLRDFQPPSPREIVDLLDRDEVVTVEGLRALVMDELRSFQRAIDGGEFNSGRPFYENGERVDEVRATEIISERLNLRLERQDITVTPEHQLRAAKRSDFTAAKTINGKRRLLVTEVKGQWHSELYTAASAQLADRYAIHPDAEQQGIFLIVWYGKHEKVAGLQKHDVDSAEQLKTKIIGEMPAHLLSLIDVFVLDVSGVQIKVAKARRSGRLPAKSSWAQPGNY